MKYRLVALDIDGTLLNSKKEIPAEVVRAVRTVREAGVTVAFATGRAVPELADQIAALPEIRYAVFASGAGLYDIREKKAFGLRSIPREEVRRILTVAAGVEGAEVMPQLVLPDRDVIQASHMARLADFHMSIYRLMYEKAMTLVPDIYAFAEACGEPVLKVNLYHSELHRREHTRALLASPALELVYSEVTSVECSAAGVSKGTGLMQLCALLEVPPEACIAVGDAENDLSMLRAAGLGIAMGNASDQVKAAAGRVVADLDHGGCAEAILTALSAV